MKKKNPIVLYVFVIVMVVLFAGLKLLQSYQQDVIDISEEMYKGPEIETSVNLSVVKKNDSEHPEKVVAGLKPGENYEFDLYVRNGRSQETNVILEIAPYDCNEEVCDDVLALDPDYFVINNGDGNEFVLEGHEIKVVNFKISLPSDLEEGMYFAAIKAIDQLPTKMFVDGGKGELNVLSAFALVVKIDVAENPPTYQYEGEISDPSEIAYQRLLIDLRLYASIILGAVTVFFLFTAFNKKS